MKSVKVLCASAAIALLAWGVTPAHIIDGKPMVAKELDRPDKDDAYVYASGMNAYIYRESLMHTISSQRHLVQGMAEGAIETDEELFIRAATALSALVAQIPHAFEPRVLIMGSRAKPLIWETWEGFVMMAAQVGKAVDDVARVASTEGVEAAKPLVAKINCGNCHKVYRYLDDYYRPDAGPYKP